MHIAEDLLRARETVKDTPRPPYLATMAQANAELHHRGKMYSSEEFTLRKPVDKILAGV